MRCAVGEAREEERPASEFRCSDHDTTKSPHARTSCGVSASHDDMTEGRSRRFAPEIEQELGRRAKAELRKSVQRVRNATPSSARAAASEALRGRLRDELTLFRSAKTIASFRPIVRKGEVDTAGIHADARALGAQVAYPFFEPRSDDAEPPTMTFRVVEDASDDSFVDRGHGFPEPRADAPLAADDSIDLVLVPALALDPQGSRLGYGAGYYDRTLARMPRAVRVGLIFDFQLLVDLPRAPHDLPMHWVVTDKRVIEVVRNPPTTT